jgi:hypothetical protein
VALLWGNHLRCVSSRVVISLFGVQQFSSEYFSAVAPTHAEYQGARSFV